MATVNMIEDEIDKIRLEIYEIIKDMSAEEMSAYFQKRGEEAAKKYGFKIVKSLDSKVKKIQESE
ncbi:MAG: hypothetical protein LBS60_04400 [Deltaproteobacteria bacterium]|jgi:hypothetical protein|nr:hypothetical protein [Deltaproteobacteria bacterium]